MWKWKKIDSFTEGLDYTSAVNFSVLTDDGTKTVLKEGQIFTYVWEVKGAIKIIVEWEEVFLWIESFKRWIYVILEK